MQSQSFVTVYLGLGSNIGDREVCLQRAVEKLHSHSGIVVEQCSSLYETEPIGVSEQPLFLNMVLEGRTYHSAYTLLDIVKKIEKEIGRTPGTRWGPREVDIDVLFYNGAIIKNDKLIIPHPEIPFRRFVLEPLCEIVPDFVCPKTQCTIRQLLAVCRDSSQVRKIKNFSSHYLYEHI